MFHLKKKKKKLTLHNFQTYFDIRHEYLLRSFFLAYQTRSSASFASADKTFRAYQTRFSSTVTSAEKSFLTYPYPTRGIDGIIQKTIKGHNSVKKFGKIMCISNNMDHISIHKQNVIKIHQFFQKTLRKIEILTSSKGHNSVEKFGNVTILHTQFHQNSSICSHDIKWKQNSDINQGPQLC